jgi:DGQHR domain-containing protein
MIDEKIGEFPAIEITQKDGTYYSACIPASILTRVSYSDVRRLASDERDIERYLGVQRPLNKNRVKKVRQYILSPDPTFPTGIIIAIDERCFGFDEDAGKIQLHSTTVDPDTGDGVNIPIGKIAKVLDGQHRLAGFLDDDGTFNIGGGDFDLNVSIFVGVDLDVQAQIFATVNLAQTKVSKSLVYELEDLSKTRSPFKTCHKIAVALDELEDSPFHKRIKRLGFVTPGRSNETITQAAFVEALAKLISRDPFSDRNALLEGKNLELAAGADLEKLPFRNLFLEGKDFDIADNVENYFRAVRKKWPEAWNDTAKKSSILPKTNAFRAFMRHLKDIYPRLASEAGTVVPVELFYSKIDDIDLTDTALSTRNFKPGSSGESAFYKVLTRETDPEVLFD